MKTSPAYLAATLSLTLAGTAPAAPLDVLLGQTTVVSTGQVYDSAIVRNGGTLILDGGDIGTNAAPSVQVEAGGRFIFHSGRINNYENQGVTELYGGRQSTESSENSGYLKLAGGDPGTQIVQLEGTLEVFSCATNRTAWEISADTTNTSALIHIYSTSNSLAPGLYGYKHLNPAATNSFGKVYTDFARFWPDTQRVFQIDFNMRSNWAGNVRIHDHAGPKPPVLRTRPAIEIYWAAQTGRTYQVQYTTNLAGLWHNLGLPVYAWTTNGYALDTTPDTNKSYRLQLLH